MILQALIPFVFLASVPLAHAINGQAPCLMLPALLVTFVTFDAWLGEAGGGAKAGRSWIFRLPLWLYVLAQLAVIVWGIDAASRGGSIGELVGLAVATGVMAGIFGMLAAHELIHSHWPAERALGIAMLCGATYPQFRISHLYGHHRLAATRKDPATARRGESAYRFVLRSVAGQFTQAWAFERRRTSQRGRSFFANRLYLYLAIIAALYGTIAVLFGWRGIVFQLLQSAVAIFILELFNYIAHYGLERRVTAAGAVEPMGPAHSWNTSHRFNNLALLNGGHHAHHHRAPTASYQHLQAQPDVPLLPSGFAGSIFLALMPPLWRRVMDPRVDMWQGKEGWLHRGDAAAGVSAREVSTQ
jgi:alkane 1-monooxygenase